MKVTCLLGDIYNLGTVEGGLDSVKGSVYQAGSSRGKVISNKSLGMSDLKNINMSPIGDMLASKEAFLLRMTFGILWLSIAVLIAFASRPLIERGQVFVGRESLRSFSIGIVWKLGYWVMWLGWV